MFTWFVLENVHWLIKAISLHYTAVFSFIDQGKLSMRCHLPYLASKTEIISGETRILLCLKHKQFAVRLSHNSNNCQLCMTGAE